MKDYYKYMIFDFKKQKDSEAENLVSEFYTASLVAKSRLKLS